MAHAGLRVALSSCARRASGRRRATQARPAARLFRRQQAAAAVLREEQPAYRDRSRSTAASTPAAIARIGAKTTPPNHESA